MLNTHSSRRFLGSAVAAVAVAVTAIAPSTSFAIKHTGGERNTPYASLGAKGYDVLACFTDKAPVQGSDMFTASHGGVAWQFASAEHRDTFKADPAKYAPLYGGFRAWADSECKLFDVDPVNGWTVTENKLHLNFNGDINDTFARNSQGFVSKAERNWGGLNK
jgi:YHS domain-containing protein